MTHGNQEWQLYLADEVSVQNGQLVLRTRAREAMHGSKPYHFTSGWVDTRGKVELAYGMFTASIQLPEELPGVWPAYWLVDDFYHCWPMGGEIDILEAVGGYRQDSVFGTYHWGSACGQDEFEKDRGRNGDVVPPPGTRFSEKFHNFTAWWNATAVTWAIDGVPYVSRQVGHPASLFIPSWPLYHIFNTALSFWAGPQPPPRIGYPVYMRVDWVGAWAWDGPGGATGHFPIPYNATGLQPCHNC
jgi:beta-glucanase (GH16 family)